MKGISEPNNRPNHDTNFDADLLSISNSLVGVCDTNFDTDTILIAILIYQVFPMVWSISTILITILIFILITIRIKIVFIRV